MLTGETAIWLTIPIILMLSAVWIVQKRKNAKLNRSNDDIYERFIDDEISV